MSTDPAATVLQLPAAAPSLRTVRLVAASLADVAGLDFEEVEDVRLAIDELSAALIDAAAPGARLEVQFTPSVGRLSVTGRVAAADAAARAMLPRLSAEIVAAIATEHTFVAADGVCCFTFAKQRPLD